jgi:hypothetical protein
MMGHLKSERGQLFCQFNLEDAVPDDHLVTINLFVVLRCAR